MRKQIDRRGSYPDGVLKLYKVANAAAPGDRPVEKLMNPVTLRYEERTAGVVRKYYAGQAGRRADRVLRVPRRPAPSPGPMVGMVAIPTDGRQYAVKEVQLPKNAELPSWDLELERLEVGYDFA